MPKFTPSGQPTALGDVESKLKKQYDGNSNAVYGTLNKIGLMKGNKATAKGAKAAKGAKPSKKPNPFMLAYKGK